MATLITDPEMERELLTRRRAIGADRYDEVWEGVYVMAPMANGEHQRLVTDLALQGDQLAASGSSTLDNVEILESGVVPLRWQLLTTADDRPAIKVSHHDGQQEWILKSTG